MKSFGCRVCRFDDIAQGFHFFDEIFGLFGGFAVGEVEAAVAEEGFGSFTIVVG